MASLHLISSCLHSITYCLMKLEGSRLGHRKPGLREWGSQWFNCWGTCVPCLPACRRVILLTGLCRSSSDTMIYSTEVWSWGSGRFKAEGLWTSVLCLSVYFNGRLQMTKMTAHITHRCHYITKFAALQDKWQCDCMAEAIREMFFFWKQHKEKEREPDSLDVFGL